MTAADLIAFARHELPVPPELTILRRSGRRRPSAETLRAIAAVLDAAAARYDAETTHDVRGAA